MLVEHCYKYKLMVTGKILPVVTFRCMAVKQNY